jgi:hypothetical protein
LAKLEGIPYGARRTQDLVEDPLEPAILYAGTTEGLWISRDSGESWNLATPRKWSINAVAVHEENGQRRILLGTEDRGVVVSDDDGRSFLPANRGFTHRVLADLAGDPQKPGHFLARFSGPDELRESFDGGRSWSLPMPNKVGTFRIFPFDGSWLVATESGRIARWNSKAGTWEEIHLVVRAGSAKTPAANGSNRLAKDLAPLEMIEIEPGRQLLLGTPTGVWMATFESAKLVILDKPD